MPKIDRILKRNQERALKARTVREKKIIGAAFEQGVKFGIRWFKGKIENSTKDLTYE